MNAVRRLTGLASRALAAAGQGDMVWGHVAVRDPDGRGIWIKAPGWGLEEAREDIIHLVSFDAQVTEGAGAAHKECHIHLEMLREHRDPQCVVHTHAHTAVAFAAEEARALGGVLAGEPAAGRLELPRPKGRRRRSGAR